MYRLTFVLALVTLLLIAPVPPPAASAQEFPHCPAGQSPQFVFGFAALQAQLGATMGEPLTCEFPDPNGTGDVLQQTSGGLAFWRKATNTPTFTNGWEHWALTAGGLVYWTGESVDPPGDAEMGDAQPATGPTPDPLGRTHIPGWLQVRWQAPLYADHSGPAISTTSPQWAFLRVLGAAEYRLEVQIEGDAAQPLATGWVDPWDVQPSEPGEGWLQADRPIPLFGGPDESAWLVGELPPGTWLRRVGAPSQIRLPVRVYSGDFAGLIALGWVNTGDVRRVDPPRASVLIIRDEPPPPNPFSGSPQALIETVGAITREVEPDSNIPASVTVAQAILESAWGESLLARVANNYLGIKAAGRLGNDGLVWFTTEEYDEQGNLFETLDPFRAYKELADSVADHHRLLLERPEYRPAIEADGDPREFARRLQLGGYSTDPAYAEKVIQLMDQYDLYSLDS